MRLERTLSLFRSARTVNVRLIVPRPRVVVRMHFRSIHRLPIGTLDLDEIGVEHEHHNVDLVAQRLSVALEYFLFQRPSVPQTRLAYLKQATFGDRTIAIEVVPI